MSELKDCPFCGSSDLLMSYSNGIYCKNINCGASIEQGTLAKNGKDVTREYVKDCWNKRVEPLWFKASASLPDGDYGWRLKKGSKIGLHEIRNGKEIILGRVFDSLNWSSGEWCLIVWPD